MGTETFANDTRISVCWLLQVGVQASKELPEFVLEVPSLHEVPLSSGKQDLPDFSRPGSAAGLPLMKERAMLQVRLLHVYQIAYAVVGCLTGLCTNCGYWLCVIVPLEILVHTGIVLHLPA